MEFEPSAQPGCVEEISVLADPVPLVDSSPKAACPVFDVLVRDPLRETVEVQSGARATVLYDAAGQPNHMYVLPRMIYADLGFERELGRGNVSAFEVGGVVKSELFIGVYPVSQRHGLGRSLPAAWPWVDLSYDEASAASAAKGPGWHMMTAHEWAAVAFWCMANGCAGGRFRNEAGLGYGNEQHICRTGSGPDSWCHDGQSGGIADLVGNALEWNSLVKLVDGEVFAAPDNDFNAHEASWLSQGRYLDCARRRVTLRKHASEFRSSAYDVPFRKVRRARCCDSSRLLQRLLIEPAGVLPQGSFYARDYGQRMLARGGEPETGGGLATAFLYDARDSRQPDVGFRVAYIA